MTKEYEKDLTESGDMYTGTREKWEEYWSAWDDGDLTKVEAMESGQDPDFFYDP